MEVDGDVPADFAVTRRPSCLASPRPPPQASLSPTSLPAAQGVSPPPGPQLSLLWGAPSHRGPPPQPPRGGGGSGGDGGARRRRAPGTAGRRGWPWPESPRRARHKPPKPPRRRHPDPAPPRPDSPRSSPPYPSATLVPQAGARRTEGIRRGRGQPLPPLPEGLTRCRGDHLRRPSRTFLVTASAAAEQLTLTNSN